MDKLKLVYIEFIRDFHKVFFPNEHGDPEYLWIACSDDDIPRLNEFCLKWHKITAQECIWRSKIPHLIKKDSSDNYKIAGVNWLYFYALPTYIKAQMAIHGMVDSAFLEPMPVSWRPTSSLQPPVPPLKTEPEPESASQSGLPEAPAGKTPC